CSISTRWDRRPSDARSPESRTEGTIETVLGRSHAVLLSVLFAGFVAVVAASAGTAPRAVSTTLGAPVLHLDADGNGVAVHTQAAAGCDTILLWLPPAKPRKVAVQHCQQGSTGTDVTSLALHGLRPAWVGYAGGNYREFSVSTTLRNRPTPVSFHPILVEDA